MADMRTIRIGVIGCGHWGPNHVRNFSSLDHGTVVAAADLRDDRLRLIRQWYPQVRTTSDYRQILADPEVDAVVVATPTVTHAPIVAAALKAGKDVLCEKPLTSDVDEARALTRLAETGRRILMVGHVYLFHDGVRHLKTYLRRRTLGRLHYVHLTRLNRGPIRNDVSVIWDLASHDVSILGYLLQFPDPQRIAVSAGSFLQRGIADVAFIGFQYADGTLANIHVSWCDPRRVREIVLVGDRRTAIWDGMASTDTIRLCEGRIDSEPRYRDYGEFQLIPRHGRVMIPHVKQREPLRVQAEHFLQCVRTRRRPITDGRFATEVIRVLRAVEAQVRARQGNGR